MAPPDPTSQVSALRADPAQQNLLMIFGGVPAVQRIDKPEENSAIDQSIENGAPIARVGQTSRRVRLGGCLAAILMGFILLVGVAPSVSASSTPWSGRYDLYRAGMFSTQVQSYDCVAAASAMMLNLVKRTSSTSASQQMTYYAYGAQYRYPTSSSLGLDPESWVAILHHYGAPSYHVVMASSAAAILRIAAARVRATGLPAGLLVGHTVGGSHAWVMSGFKSALDPATHSTFTLSGVYVEGPHWPTQRYYLGAFDLPPNSYETVSWMTKYAMPKPYQEPNGATPWTGKYVAIVP